MVEGIYDWNTAQVQSRFEQPRVLGKGAHVG